MISTREECVWGEGVSAEKCSPNLTIYLIWKCETQQLCSTMGNICSCPFEESPFEVEGIDIWV